MHDIFYFDVRYMTLPGVDFACKVVLEEEKHYHVTREIFSLILVEIEGVVLGRS